jgi:hypothetical protein
MPSHRIDPCAGPSASTSLLSLLLRPRWPYVLGAIAGPLLGICLLVLLATLHLTWRGSGTAGFLATVGGVIASTLLGIAWFGVLRGGHSGVGPVAGSFAYPLATIYAVFHPEWRDMFANAALITGALAAFGWGHVAAPSRGIVRMLATTAAMLWSFLFLGVLARWPVPGVIVTTAFVALALLCIALAFSFPPLRLATSRYRPEGSWD